MSENDYDEICFEILERENLSDNVAENVRNIITWFYFLCCQCYL